MSVGEIADKSMLVIVDYNNVINIRGENFESQLTHQINEIFNRAHECDSAATRVELRLYGGWLEDGIFTQAASRISQVIESDPFFPVVIDGGSKQIRGSVQMPASSVSRPDQRWSSLFKQSAGSPRLQIDKNLDLQSCEDTRDQCPIHILRRFTSKQNKRCPVDSCDRVRDDVFRQSRQKKVDVMMAADIVAAARAGFGSIAIFSDDTDLYPAILDASLDVKSIFLLKTNQSRNDIECELLRDAGVQVRTIE